MIGALDRSRAAALRAVVRVPALRSIVARRDARLLVSGAVSALVALGAAVAFPGILFILGPLVLGVPHVASDVRHLVLRRALPRHVLVLLALGCGALLAVRGAALLGVGPSVPLRWELSLGCALCVTLAAAGGIGEEAGGARARAAGFTLLLAAGSALALRAPATASLMLAYAHNVVGLAIWVLVFRKRRAVAVPMLGLAAVGTVLLFLPAVQLWVPWTGPWALALLDEANQITPQLAPNITLGIGLSFVYLQSLHYSAWLVLIPQDDARAEGTRTFRMSAQLLRRDFGPIGLAVLGLAILAMLAGSVASLQRARGAYLALATFHAYLEVGLLAYFLGRRRAP